MTQFVSPAQGDVTATKTPSWRFGTSNRAKLGPKKGGTGPRYPKVKLQSSRKYPPDILKLDISIICLASPLKVPTTEGPRWQPPAPGPTWSRAQPGSPSLALGPGDQNPFHSGMHSLKNNIYIYIHIHIFET